MAKLLHLHLLAILSIALTSHATQYIVGDTSGWDISTSLDTWPQDKVFKVGDVLVFMYSPSNSVIEVTKQNFDTCNTSNALKTYSNGNTTVTLSEPGDRYFVSRSRLYCFGGMKLHVHVAANEVASPIGSPQPQPSATSTPLPAKPSSKSNKPSANIPTSSVISNYGGSNSLVVAFVSFMAFYLLCMVQA